MDWGYELLAVVGFSALVSLAIEVEKMRREVKQLLTEIRDALKAK